MNKLAIGVVAVALAFSGVAAASTHGELDVGPGVVGPASPVYGLELAVDNAAMSVGLAQEGGVAQERAAEASVAAANNNSEAAARAAGAASNIAERADSEEDVEGIDKAMNSLNETVTMMEARAEKAPNEQARQGMLTAAENMKGALANMEQAKQNRNDRANQPAGDGEQARQDKKNGEDQINRTATDGEPANRTTSDEEQLNRTATEMDSGNQTATDVEGGNRTITDGVPT